MEFEDRYIQLVRDYDIDVVLVFRSRSIKGRIVEEVDIVMSNHCLDYA